MAITKDEVLHVAKLSRLEVDETAVDKFSEQLGMILEYVEKLNAVDTTGVPPTAHPVYMVNAFREDYEKPHLKRDAALSNAPEQEDGNFVVPKIIG